MFLSFGGLGFTTMSHGGNDAVEYNRSSTSLRPLWRTVMFWIIVIVTRVECSGFDETGRPPALPPPPPSPSAGPSIPCPSTLPLSFAPCTLISILLPEAETLLKIILFYLAGSAAMTWSEHFLEWTIQEVNVPELSPLPHYHHHLRPQFPNKILILFPLSVSLPSHSPFIRRLPSRTQRTQTKKPNREKTPQSKHQQQLQQQCSQRRFEHQEPVQDACEGQGTAATSSRGGGGEGGGGGGRGGGGEGGEGCDSASPRLCASQRPRLLASNTPVPPCDVMRCDVM